MPNITFYDSNSEMVGVSRRRTETSNDSSGSLASDGEVSYKSSATAPTEYSDRPSLTSNDARYPSAYTRAQQLSKEADIVDDPRSSAETYASTAASDEEQEDEQSHAYEVPEYRQDDYLSDILSATPADFSALFPSSRRLTIKHDDTTSDGNMNLRIETQVNTTSGRKRDIQLFHLRMHDLKNREFSFRRYGRESGREVCHSVRKYQKPAAEKRPTFSRSLTNTLSGAFHRTRSDMRTHTLNNLKRNDSGYGSMAGETAGKPLRSPTSDGESQKSTCVCLPTNTTKLEFSNYAQVDVKRRSGKGGKRYDFEYWGSHYSWKRIAKKDGSSTEVSYYLMRTGSDHSIARVVPEVLSSTESDEEVARGGWIPPCSLWITDEKIINSVTDASDVIVATGLIALVDDCIKRRFHSKHSKRIPVPGASRKTKIEYVGPKRLISEAFNRPGSRRSASGN
ncbi:MAG: hypothetical protein M1821_007935 [Bathelium mastoideum]|nr:MAG: hypothetical protein M1821_007935 [Bathelium mastoideum]